MKVIVADSGRLEDVKTLRSIKESVFRSKRVVCLIGAGVSTSAGIPDFRSVNGLYSSKKMGSKDLFSAQTVFRDAEASASFFRLCEQLHRKAEKAKLPTDGAHQLLRTLDRKSKLVRLYSQNIDGLELVQNSKLVRLHGTLSEVRCACGYRGSTDQVALSSFSQGRPAECPECSERNRQRSEAGKRLIKPVGWLSRLRPSIVLYDESLPPALAENILKTSDQDLSRPCDFVLVMGTSLKIPGFKSLVKDFANARRRSGPSHVVLVNDSVVSSEWSSVFDYQILGDCDAWSRGVLKLWRKDRPEDFRSQPKLMEITNRVKFQVTPVKRSMDDEDRKPAKRSKVISA